MKVRRKDNGSIVVIFILIICLGLCVFYIVNEKVNGPLFGDKVIDEKEKDNDVNKSDDRELNEVEKAGIISLIEDKYNYLLAQYYPIEDVSKLNNDQVMKFAKEKFMLESNFSDSALLEEANKHLYKVKLNHEDIKCSCGKKYYNYNKNTHMYSLDLSHQGHGASGDGRIESHVYYISGNVKNKTITVKANVLYERGCTSDVCMPCNSYYKTYNDAINHTNPVLGDPSLDNPYVVTDYAYNEIKWMLPTTVYTFIINDGEYKLKSVDI